MRFGDMAVDMAVDPRMHVGEAPSSASGHEIIELTDMLLVLLLLLLLLPWDHGTLSSRLSFCLRLKSLTYFVHLPLRCFCW